MVSHLKVYSFFAVIEILYCSIDYSKEKHKILVFKLLTKVFFLAWTSYHMYKVILLTQFSLR